jgi:hypothetical protein
MSVIARRWNLGIDSIEMSKEAFHEFEKVHKCVVTCADILDYTYLNAPCYDSEKKNQHVVRSAPIPAKIACAGGKSMAQV